MACAIQPAYYDSTSKDTQSASKQLSTLQRLFVERVRPTPACLIYRLFLITNETISPPAGEFSTYDLMASIPQIGDTYVGVSGFFNLNVVCLRRNIRKIVIIDNSIVAIRFWEIIARIIKLADTREECIEVVEALLILDPSGYFPDNGYFPDKRGSKFSRYTAYSQITEFKREITQGLSWLSTDERFERIQQIFRAGLFVIALNDLTQPEEMGAVRAAIEEDGGIIDTVYVSNVKALTEHTDHPRFRKAVKALASSQDSYVIEAIYNKTESILYQRVMRASEFLSE